MPSPQTVQNFVRARPFRPFRIRMIDGRTHEIRHPEMIRVLRSDALVFRGSVDLPDEFERVPMILMESVTPLDGSTP